LLLRKITKLLAAAAIGLPAPSLAAGFVLGSGNTAVIEPPISHPAETPCVVTLFANDVFGANNLNYTYAPPSACPGPWAKVILTADIGLNKGIQYDRSGLIWLGGVNIWFGTTPPSPRQPLPPTGRSRRTSPTTPPCCSISKPVSCRSPTTRTAPTPA
jgi:hypothetical protein